MSETVILASASPRRRELLHYLYEDYRVIPADIDEHVPEGTPPERVGELTARAKAACVAARHPKELVIAADTVVAVDGQVLGKPRDREDACRMLGLLSGREHRVYTGVVLRRGDRERGFTACTRVRFYPLTGEQIRAYAATGEPDDKAGAYGIQGQGSLLVEEIHGDYYNVMGLPVARLAREIAAFLDRRA